MDENTTGLTVVKRSGEAVTFDTSKIPDAISNSIRVVDLFAGVGGLLEGLSESLSHLAETVSELMDSVRDRYREMIIQIIEHLRDILLGVKYRRKERLHPRQLHALLVARVLIICVKHFTVGLLEVAPEIRKIYLLRSQDRGSSDKGNNIENLVVTC